MRQELGFDLHDAPGHPLDLGSERARPREPEVVRERQHPLGEPVVLPEQVALAVLKMRELRRECIEVGQPFDRHGGSYRQTRGDT